MRQRGKGRKGPCDHAAELKRLAEMILTVEGRAPGGDATRRRVTTGWGAAGGLMDGLNGGAVHEWFGVEGPVPESRVNWTPPLGIVTHLAWRALADASSVVWIGRRVWPHGRWLVRRAGEDRRLLERSLLVDPPREAGVWAIDLAARCSAVAAVVADGTGLDMSATRRLQLAAEAGGALLLLVRPPREITRRSAAATRWRVRRVPSVSGAPRWDVQLVRCKGLHASQARDAQEGAPRAKGEEERVAGNDRNALEDGLRLEWDREQGAVVVSSDVVDRSDPPSYAQIESVGVVQRSA